MAPPSAVTSFPTPWSGLLEGEEVASRTYEPARTGRDFPLPRDLPAAVRESLEGRGVVSLYGHQLAAREEVRAGRDVIVATGTASGKSLAFNLPVLETLVTSPAARALYLYPTKALAQDQARSLAALAMPRVRPAIYDGDTPTEQRAHIRRSSNAILTNPDMLHVGILPNHDRWADTLHNLAFVVVDEAHVYRGVFGSHVGNVLRRLRRLAGIYGASPRFLLASATIANPRALAEALTGCDTTAVVEDTAPRAGREIVLWNPPLLDTELGTRGSPLAEAALLLASLATRGVRTICFSKSRKSAELIHRFAAERAGKDIAQRLAPYRAGYTPAQRRELERRLANGELVGVSATDALELGIDIGGLDCAISVGFPGTIASLRQQWGRAGRVAPGLAVLIASEDALDQFFMREPEALIQRSVEAALSDHTSPRIFDAHLLEAAFEAPLTQSDAEILGPQTLERAALLPELELTPAGYVWRGRDRPAGRISLRSGDTAAFAIVEDDTGSVLGLVERERAYSTVHEGAVYLHLGEQYLVRQLDLDSRVALVARASVDWYTQTKRETHTAIERTHSSRRVAGVELHWGEVSVTDQIVAYQRRSTRDGSTLDTVPLLLPPTSFLTEAVWFSPDDTLLADLEKMPVLLGTLHATEHALISLLPLWAMCDRWDIGGLSTNSHLDTGRPTIFVYDGHAGGVGITLRGFTEFAGWMHDTHALVASCPCRAGCPSCVQSPKCGNLNEHLDKRGASVLLARMRDAND